MGTKTEWFASRDVERVTGIEPAQPAWKAGTLPLSYTRESESESYQVTFGTCSGRSVVASASALGAEDREFESPRPDHFLSVLGMDNENRRRTFE